MDKDSTCSRVLTMRIKKIEENEPTMTWCTKKACVAIYVWYSVLQTIYKTLGVSLTWFG